mgnify:CR=1 FL=1
MIIENIDLLNFKKYAKQQISLGPRIVGIFGPNGAGKSTLFDAICWCLYGVTPTIGKEGELVRQDELVRDGEQEMGVELTFTYGNQRYVVYRFYSVTYGTKAKAYVDGTVMANSSKEVTAFIVRTLGLDAKAFISASFIRQKEIDLLTSQRASKRKEIINRLFNLQLYDQFFDDVRRQQRELDTLLVQLKERKENLETAVEHYKEIAGDEKELSRAHKEVAGKLKEATSRLAAQSEHVDSLLSQRERWRELGSERDRLTSQEEALYHRLRDRKGELKEIAQARERISLVSGRLDELAPSVERASALSQVRDRYRSLKQKEEELERRRWEVRGQYEKRQSAAQEDMERLSSEIANQEGKVRDLERRHGELSCAHVDPSSYTKKIAKAREDEQLIDVRINDLGSRLGALRSRLESLVEERRSLESLEGASQCPTCHQSVTDELRECLEAKNDSARADLGKKIQALETKLEGVRQLREDSRTQIAALEHKRQKAEEDKYELSTVASSLERERTRLGDLRSRRDAVKKALDDLSREQSEAEGRLVEAFTKARDELRKISFDQAEYERVLHEAREHDRLSNELEHLSEKVARESVIRKETDDIRASIEDAEGKKRSLSEQMGSFFVPPEKLTAAQKSKQALEEEVSVLRVNEGRLSEQIGSARAMRERMEEAQAKLDEVRTSLKECQASLHHHQVLKEAFRNIPINIHERLKPLIQSEVSWLLNEVTQGKYPAVAIDEEYTVRVSSNGVFYPIYRFSGGEKDLINLCLRVGISRVLVSLSREQGFAHLESLFLDETFSSLDGERRRNLLSSLRALEHFFSQIVIITHVEDVKEMIPYAYEVEEAPDGQSSVNLLKQSL